MSEWSAVQQPMICYAAEVGWAHISQAEALQRRGGEERLFFFQTLKSQLLALNPVIFDDARANDVIRQLTLLHASIKGNRDALAFDSDVVASVIQNIDVIKDLFATMMREQAPAYLPLTKGWDDKAKERAMVAFEDQEKRETFFKFFQQMQSLYDILSPDAFLRPHIDDYNALAVLFSWIRQAYSDRVYADREFTHKAKALLVGPGKIVMKLERV